MTKKHFETFAREIAASNNDDQTRMFAAITVIRVAQEFNPRFDRERFLKACGLSQD